MLQNNDRFWKKKVVYVLTKKNSIKRPYFQSSDSASSEKAGLDDLPSRGKLNFRKNRFRGKLAVIST